MLCEDCVRGFILVQGNLMKFGILAFPAWTINDTRLKTLISNDRQCVCFFIRQWLFPKCPRQKSSINH